MTYDVLILGGGPAGCATALALQQHGVERVLVVEASQYHTSRIGETIPPDTRLLLEEFRLWPEFLQAGHEPCLGSCSAWGEAQLGYNDFLCNPHGNGWHLDRRQFDAWLARSVVARGMTLRIGTRCMQSTPTGQAGFQVSLRAGDQPTDTVQARFVVDATGCSAHWARRMGARQRWHDRLMCGMALFTLAPKAPMTSLTLLEATAYGWWYAAKLPGRQVVAALASDPTLVKQADLGTPETWLQHVQATQHVASALADCAYVPESFQRCTAPSYLLDPVVGANWLAVGDAASAYDPLMSQGIYKALADGLHAAAAIAAALGGDQQPLSAYQDFMITRFATYLAQRHYFYNAEQRWPTSSFWRTRQARSFA